MSHPPGPDGQHDVPDDPFALPDGPPAAHDPASGQPLGRPAAYDPAPGQPSGPPPAYAPASGPADRQPYGQLSSQPYTPGPAPEIPGMGRRLVARLIDGLLFVLVLGVLGVLLFGAAFSRVQTDAAGTVTAGEGAVVAAYLGWYALGVVLTLLYEVGLVATRGATLGKQLMRVKVVREADGAVPGWGPSVLRWLLPQAAGFLTCGLATLLVYVSPLFDGTGRQQGWHDKVAGTQVVST